MKQVFEWMEAEVPGGNSRVHEQNTDFTQKDPNWDLNQ